MSTQTKISFWGAVLINLNIVIGASFFLNAQTIQTKSGFLAPLSWLFCGLLLVPLVAILAKLAALYPSDGGIYLYSHHILGRFWGFMSGWGYFIGAIAGNAVVVRAFSTYLQQLSFLQPLVQLVGFSQTGIDLIIVLIFAFFNLMNVQFLERVQLAFTMLKTIPLILLIIGLFFLIDTHQLAALPHVRLENLFTIFPMVLFGYVGIEACCSVMDKIDARVHHPSSVLWFSFALIVLIYVLLQSAIFLIYGEQSVNPFLNLVPQLTQNALLISVADRLVYLAILCSYMGGFYGMFYYNNWNLYVLAQDKSLIGDHYLTLLNKNRVPWLCVLVQTFLLAGFLLVTRSDLYLEVMSNFGIVLAYLLTAISFFVLYRSWLALLALASCGLLLYLTTFSLFQAGIHHLMPFLMVMLLGLLLSKKKIKGV